MSRRDDSIPLGHMLAHAREVAALCDGLSNAELAEDRVLGLAVVRLFEIVGEAANRVSDVGQSAHTEIPWAEIVGLRNRIIHGYDSVDFDILWTIITSDLPPLIAQLEAIVGD